MVETNQKLYNLVFERKLKEGFDIDVVRENLRKIFNNNPDIVEQLFSKDATILKKNLTKNQAEKYKTVLAAAGAQCSIIENIENKPLKKQKEDETVAKNVDDLVTVTRFLVRVISFNQKMIWALLILVVISILLWGTLYLVNPAKIITAIDANEVVSNEFSLDFETDEGEFSLDLKTYYPIRKIHLTRIKEALHEYYKKNKRYPVSSNKGKGWDGLYAKWGRSGKNWIPGLVPEYLPTLPRDPRNNNKKNMQYLYKSNGKNYKLIAHGIRDSDFVFAIDKSFIDPKRKKYAYGYWSKGAKNW